MTDPFAPTLEGEFLARLDTAKWLAAKVVDRLGQDGHSADSVSALTYARSLAVLLDEWLVDEF